MNKFTLFGLTGIIVVSGAVFAFWNLTSEHQNAPLHLTPLSTIDSKPLTKQTINTAQAEITAPLTTESARQVNARIHEHSKQIPQNLSTTVLSGSLQGLRHDIRLQTDSQGNLIINRDVKDLIEFYLSAVGEAPLEIILMQIQHDFAQQLQFPAKDQANQILRNFVDYKIALAEQAPSAMNHATIPEYSSGMLRQQKSQVQQLREQFFTPDQYDSFFAEEDTYDNYMLDQLDISRNEHLSQEEKRIQSAALAATLPPEVKQLRESVSRFGELHQETEQLKSQGASAGQLFEVRAEKLGSEAATALAELDQQRANWKQQLNQYVEQRNLIRASDMSSADQATAIKSLIEDSFKGTERIRVRALDADI